MPSQLEERIELSFDISFEKTHSICDQKYCVNKGGEICISEEFKEYLKKNYKIDQFLEKSERQKNDLEWLLDKDQNIRKIFTSSDGYRLRFKEHDSLACGYFNELFLFYQKPASKRLMNNGRSLIDSFADNSKYQNLLLNLHNQLWEDNVLWGLTLKNKLYKYEGYFLSLCENTRKESVSDIYRLYDIFNKKNENQAVKLPDFFSLLFSLGHGNKFEQRPESISEFVSHYEFFKQFSSDCQKIYESIARNESVNNYRNRALLDSYVFLASEEGFKKAKDVWSLYYETAKNLFGTGINFDPSISDEEFVRSLKSHLACTPSPFPINFSSIHSAAYHAFKHKNICKFPAENLSVCSYLEVIREVVLTGSALVPRPDQFGKGRIFTFEKKLQVDDKNHVRVYLLKGHQKNTFILSCF